MQLHVWRDFRFLLPPDWEMLQFSPKNSVGKCAFGDRYAIRLEFSWRKVDSEPNKKLLLQDYSNKLKTQQNIKNIKISHHASWDCILGETNNVLLSRCIKYFKREKCIIQLVFVWTMGNCDVEILKKILISFKEEPYRKDSFKHIKEFGLNFLVNKTYIKKEVYIQSEQ